LESWARWLADYEEGRIMPMRKVAISLPEPVLETVDRLAAERGASRSSVISTILAMVARAKRDRDITAAVDALFANARVAEEQKRTADRFLRVSPWSRTKR
jgi:metal-responsive CopG/Arc/MetJ family transcriptional regulator